MEQSAEVSEKAEEAEGGKEEVAVEERGEGRQGEERAEAALVGQGMARPTKSRFDRTCQGAGNKSARAWHKSTAIQ